MKDAPSAGNNGDEESREPKQCVQEVNQQPAAEDKDIRLMQGLISEIT